MAVGVALLGSICSFSQSGPDKRQEEAAHLRKAGEYIRAREPAAAIPELQAVVDIDPGNVDAQGNLGVLLFFQRRFADAVPHLRSAVSARPDLWKIQGLLGLAEGQLQNSSASRADLEAAFPHLLEPGFQLEVGRALIDNYTATGDLEKAADVVSTLLVSRPTDPSLLFLSYRLNSDLAGRAMLTLALSAPDSAEMHQVMARELAHHDNNDAAIANYRDALKIDPQLAGLHSELGDLLFNSGDQKLKAEAPAEFQAALAVDPRDEKATLSLGMIAVQAGDLKTALADDSRALELDPNDTDAATELAKVLARMNQRDKAEQMFERAIQIDPTNYVAHYRLAGLYRQEGRTEDMKQQLAEYLKYKQMRDKLEQIFNSMRVASGQRQDSDAADGNP